MEKTHGYINLYTSYVCDNRIATCKKNNGDTEVKVLHDNLEDELRTENRIKYINYNIDYICFPFNGSHLRPPPPPKEPPPPPPDENPPPPDE